MKKSAVVKILLLAGGTVAGAGLVAGVIFLRGAGCNAEARYTNPYTGCVSSAISKSSYTPFRNELIGYLNEERQNGRLAEAAVFFRDLNAGPTFGINELANFSPASLLKIPMALAYLRYEEENPGILETRIRYTKNGEVLEQEFAPSKSIQKNETYTVEEVLFHMIAYSDNVSYSVLADYMKQLPEGETFVFQAYRELGIIDPTNASREVVSVHGYASIFRLLYNVSYLESDLSEKMLAWLAASDFNQGIVAGVPEGTVVAHKFGERSFMDADMKQLHDCGIVYYPRNPYVLCVMTQGNTMDGLTDIIGNVSQMTYEEIDSRKL